MFLKCYKHDTFHHRKPGAMVPFFKMFVSLAGLLPVIASLALPGPFRSGFHLPDSILELTFKYKTEGNLIILPVLINDSVQVDLILDTGASNLVLFGKTFQKYFQFVPDGKVQFSGLGSGKTLSGKLSIDNKVEINSVIGLDIPVVVVSEKNLFSALKNVDGYIGYEILQKFEIEINPARQTISFRSPMHERFPYGFTRIPFKVKGSRPILDCAILLSLEQKRLCDLMIDTGSAFGLLMMSTDEHWIDDKGRPESFARGFSGEVKGVEIKSSKIHLKNFVLDTGSSRIIRSAKRDYASIGMGILSQYSFILNYVKGYVELRKANEVSVQDDLVSIH